MKRQYQRKIKLSSATKLIKWAPFWAVLRKAGKGKRAHPSSITKHRRHWRSVKLKIKPRCMHKNHLG